ncbi:GYDIA family GHMP kinase [Aureispira sp. CCB-E]|uniref:GYDIA family GHMP kinase n=1 Tax=Aureispira sp. CCB-E TaxID=3051121 RepID=UPI002869110C|nr:GYDIA family GHMP kinase [Aureispira sp. CCB-E]WMX14926.1 GYDIA family GHMP kinase [Aureispira sp. CCB-E]
MSFSMRTNGKLLLTGEYFVTEGAVSLALPTQLGQTLEVQQSNSKGDSKLIWKSYSKDNTIWFQATFQLPNFKIIASEGGEDHLEVAENLQNILKEAQNLNPSFLKEVKGTWEAQSVLEFSRDWGLGSSSTLITMIAEWAQIDPFLLLENTFGGSGYDIVAAKSEGPLLFQKFNGNNRWDKSNFNPEFKDQLYFVYLGKKQSSREALVYYTVTPPEERERPLPRITQITHDIAQYTHNLEDFEALIEEHENLVQSIIQQPRAKELYFEDYWGEIKSLGGWGGDFVLATSNQSEEQTKAYFQEKGFDTVLKYKELIKEY